MALRAIHRSLPRFVLVGLANSAVGYGLILVFHYGLGASAMVANLGGYTMGGLLSYVLHRNFTFESGRPHAQALPRFAILVASCFALNLVVPKFALGP